MSKSSRKDKAEHLTSPSEGHTSESATANLSDLRQNSDLWYRILILLHDLNNVKDSSSNKRLSQTTNELYISEPYFRDFEATKIRKAFIDSVDEAGPSDGMHTDVQDPTGATVEQALHSKLANFLDKRKASGDARPCGPHDMFPIYSSTFGITREEVKDERCLGRLRKSGLGSSNVMTGIEGAGKETRKSPGKGSKGKGKK